MKTLFKKSNGKNQKSKDIVNFSMLIALCTLFFSIPVCAQIYSEKDVEVCNSKFSFAVEKNLTEKAIGDVIVEVGKSFIGTPYDSYTLEKDGEEQLVINLTGLDCTTFLENVVVLARLIKNKKSSFEDYMDELTFLRYRDGKIDQYPSRLHYFSDWIYNNQQKNIIKDVTGDIGGEPINFNLNFMSTHPEFYRQLKENPEFIPVIEKQEKEISERTFCFIPKAKVLSIEDKILNGNLIAFTTNKEGLDIGHVGIAVKMENGRIHLLHAPVAGSKVQISENPLSVYINKLKRDTGIIVLRVLENN